MAAPKGNQNAAGNSGGKSVNDRELAAEVRSLTLNKIKTLFELKDEEMNNRQRILHDRILEKLAGSVLPRLNEHTGQNGDPIEHEVTVIKIIKPDGDSIQTKSETIPSVGVSDG
jgi:hypothetical protein